MMLTGKQKAAMLLTSLDVGAATDLLQGFEPDVIQELAVELTVGHPDQHGAIICNRVTSAVLAILLALLDPRIRLSSQRRGT